MSSQVAEVAARARAWLASIGRPTLAVEPLLGDVSPRRYLRARFDAGRGGAASAIVSFYPEAARDAGRRFLASTQLLSDVGVRVPAIEASALEEGFILVEDLGPRTLYDLEGLDWPELARWIEPALAVLPRLRRLPVAAVASLNPALDRALLRRELDQTWSLLFAAHGVEADPGLEKELRAALDALCSGLDNQPRTPCHRDFMARNLVPLGREGVGVLDHQDLRIGPASYDLASLLNDSLYPPARVEERWRDEALDAAALRREDYDRAVAQRGLKIAGTFLAFAAGGSSRHLRLLRPSVERALDALARLPEGEAVTPSLRRWWREASVTLPD